MLGERQNTSRWASEGGGVRTRRRDRWTGIGDGACGRAGWTSSVDGAHVHWGRAVTETEAGAYTGGGGG